MDSNTRPSGASEAGTSLYCHWHKGPSGTATLIDVVDQGSGPGGYHLYACDPCREQHHLTPLSERGRAAS